MEQPKPAPVPEPTPAPVQSAVPAPTPAPLAASPAPAQPAAVPPQPAVQPVPQAAPAPQAPRGRAVYKGLKITIKDAVLNTPADPNGLADPYCKLKQNGAKLMKTKVIKKTLKPTWNESKVIDVVGIDGVIRIGVEVWDQDQFLNDFMCKGEIFLHADVQGRIFATDLKVVLKNQAGKDDGLLNFSLG